jgi:hypothetical protein
MRALLADVRVAESLKDVGLSDIVSRVPLDKQVELLFWEGTCGRRSRQIVIGIFDLSTKKIVTVDEKPILFIRVAIS